jgi:2-polyprenyl-3-methyl-5-hydroxy-6-metoxy-1,4-benzoquinol methylase
MFETYRIATLLNKLKFRIKTFPTWVLWKNFKFDKWHIYGSTQPKYQGEVIRMLNELDFRFKIVEIGCGLGSILKSIDYVEKFGLDLDRNVISAAKFINRRSQINFVTGSFDDAKKYIDIDVLLAVNWVHNLDPAQLLFELSYFSQRGALVLTEGVEDYRFYHDRIFFASHFIILKEVFVPEGKRHLFLLAPLVREDFN